MFSNSSWIRLLDRGALKRDQLKGEHATTDQYFNKQGVKKFKGNKQLKSTQLLDSVSFFNCIVLKIVEIISLDSTRFLNFQSVSQFVGAIEK